MQVEGKKHRVYARVTFVTQENMTTGEGGENKIKQVRVLKRERTEKRRKNKQDE